MLAHAGLPVSIELNSPRFNTEAKMSPASNKVTVLNSNANKLESSFKLFSNYIHLVTGIRLPLHSHSSVSVSYWQRLRFVIHVFVMFLINISTNMMWGIELYYIFTESMMSTSAGDKTYRDSPPLNSIFTVVADYVSSIVYYLAIHFAFLLVVFSHRWKEMWNTLEQVLHETNASIVFFKRFKMYRLFGTFMLVMVTREFEGYITLYMK